MQFNSISFLFFFLPLFLFLYYLFPSRYRVGWLVLVSLFFYAQAGSHTVLILLLLGGNTVLSYFFAQWLHRNRKGWILAVALGLLTTELVFFKCFQGGIYLPTGMSFYLFQIAAYLVDIYTNKLQPDKNPIVYAGQITMFPKLLMGPLADPVQLQQQVNHPEHSFEHFHQGLQELILGLAMKVLLANRVGGLWSQAAVIGYDGISTAFAWLALISFAMQLYFDFWSYSIMAMGLGRMIGFHLPENFLDPYASRSVSEFWRRWHVTLGLWFRNYLYIPLGGNRKGTGRTLINLLAVWLFTGLWHGIGGNYLLWAMVLFCFILMERLWLRKILDRTGFLATIYTIVVILLSWIPFAIGDPTKMLIFASKIFGVGGPALNPTDYITWGKEYIWLLLAGGVMASPLPRIIWQKIRNHIITDIVLFLLFWVTVFFIATSAQDPFLYFQY